MINSIYRCPESLKGPGSVLVPENDYLWSGAQTFAKYVPIVGIMAPQPLGVDESKILQLGQ